jgi:hypothetical protein
MTYPIRHKLLKKISLESILSFWRVIFFSFLLSSVSELNKIYSILKLKEKKTPTNLTFE